MDKGRSIFESLRNSIVGMFKSMVLRPMISAVMNPIAQGVTGMLGLSGAASAGTMGGMGGGLSSLGTIGSIASGFGNFGSGVMSGLTAWGEGGSVMGLLGQGSSLFSGGLASGLGTIAGALGPIAIGAAALYAISQSFKGETRSGGRYSYGADGAQLYTGPSGGEIASTEVKNAINSTVKGINSILSGLGSSAQLTGFQAGLETSGKGRGGVFAGGTLTGGIMFGESGQGNNYHGTLYERTSTQSPDAEAAINNFAIDLQQATLQALQAATDIPQSIKDMLKDIDAEALTKETAGALLSSIEMTVAGVSMLRDAVKQLPMANLANMSFDAANGLIKFAGGIENLMGQLGDYISEFYTTEEKAGMQAQVIAQALEALGFDPGSVLTRQDFRELVESRNVETTEGQRQLAALLEMGPEFARLADYMQETGYTLEQVAAAAPQSAILNQMVDPAKSTADSAANMATGIQTSNEILNKINNNLASMTAVANAAVEAAQAASKAAQAAAAQAALVSSQPTFNYNIGDR
jgi:hypothetical protein